MADYDRAAEGDFVGLGFRTRGVQNAAFLYLLVVTALCVFPYVTCDWRLTSHSPIAQRGMLGLRSG